MNRLIHAIACASVLAGCAGAATGESPMKNNITLQPMASVAVAPTTMLRYDGVADSRCPPDVQCVWKGELAYKFTLTGGAGSESFGLTAAKPGFDAATVAGLHIALGDNPEPKVRAANAPVAPAQAVTLVISRR